MTCEEAIYHLKSLRLLRNVYNRLLTDPHKSVYNNRDLKKLIIMTNNEILNIIDSIHNMELSNSYDQNTGKVHYIYRNLSEEELLKRKCGGPKYEQ